MTYCAVPLVPAKIAVLSAKEHLVYIPAIAEAQGTSKCANIHLVGSTANIYVAIGANPVSTGTNLTNIQPYSQ